MLVNKDILRLSFSMKSYEAIFKLLLPLVIIVQRLAWEEAPIWKSSMLPILSFLCP